MKVSVKRRVQRHPIKLTQGLLNQLKWDAFHYPGYLPDFTPSDYDIIPGLKCDLGGQHFIIKEDLQSVIAEFFAKQDAEWYSTGIRKLILHYNKCFDEQGDHIENIQ